MAPTTLLDLPTELLQNTFDYLDWDQLEYLTPSRPDIHAISVTCHHLREAVLPILFRNVTLKLRWVDGALIEPALFRLRKQCPHLANYVRCVHVETLFGHFVDAEWKMKTFTVPENLQSWINPAPGTPDRDVDQGHQNHQNRINDKATALFESPQYKELLSKCPALIQDHAMSLSRQLFEDTMGKQPGQSSFENTQNPRDPPQRFGETTLADFAREEDGHSAGATAKRRSQYRNLRLQQDALFIIMLCLPHSVTSLVFESLPTSPMDALQNSFALHVAVMAIDIFGNRLQRLTMITKPFTSHGSAIHMPNNVEAEDQDGILSTEVISSLHAIKTLTLASSDEQHSRTMTSISQYLTRWHAISNTVVHLKLHSLDGEPQDLVKLIKGFSRLQDLTLSHVGLTLPMRVHHQNRQANSSPWLSFLIHLRRQTPDVAFHLHELRTSSTYWLSTSGLRWLLKEAVPTGCKVDFERETRLVEDFESFLPLWFAEDSARGDAARQAREDVLGGQLVDAAMSSRWRGLYSAPKR